MILVDGANVVGSRPDGWWRDRAGAAARLVSSLVSAGLSCTVVLEGAARAGVPEGLVDGSAAATDSGSPVRAATALPTTGLVRVVHAPGSGDDTLASLCGPGVTLVTADRGLCARAAAAGADRQGPRWLLDQLTATAPP